jgi:protoporphyrin/coproporphyrin ferrochelatase
LTRARGRVNRRMPKRAVLIATWVAGFHVGSRRPALPREFLGDERVLDLPAPLRWLLLEAIILPTRPKKDRARVLEGLDAGGLAARRDLGEREAEARGGARDPRCPVHIAMRYGNPSIASAWPGFPTRGRRGPPLSPVPPLRHGLVGDRRRAGLRGGRAQAPGCGSAACSRSTGTRTTSRCSTRSPPFPRERPTTTCSSATTAFPERHLRKADSSHAHCTMVSRLLHDLLAGARDVLPRAVPEGRPRSSREGPGLDPARYSVSYQSRLAGEPWLRALYGL